MFGIGKKEEDDDLFFDLHKDDDDEDEFCGSGQSKASISNIRREKEIFVSMINQPIEEDTEPFTTKQFWTENKTNIPLLFRSDFILLSIPASSAFIERFFSVCGVICKKRAGNMTDYLKTSRAFLKCNLV
ncbi:unnamed protein product [Brachionus calyciflorus]|uniref:HAT C-terminal dimerisation domain-containing protein n=1 Tax=Brachionus calyciflorus TaxID=104777 RepID=A0A814PN60_9BILA|nr:unnamed protein product [Brachionus calyciflorus]